MSIANRVSIDHATPDEFADAAVVYQTAALDLAERLRSEEPRVSPGALEADLRQATAALQHLYELNDRSVVVARDGARVVGMAAVQIQPPHAHIAFFFVHPAAQGKGIGRRLLERLKMVIAEKNGTVVTLAASRDPRSWQRYLQIGLQPGPPLLAWRASHPTFPLRMPEHTGLQIRSATIDDLAAIAGLDRMVRGADRRSDLADWLRDGSNMSLYDRVSGDIEGFGFVSTRHQHCQIGPVAARSLARFPMVLDLALHLAHLHPNPRRLPWRVDVSARNVASATPLLQAGFSVEAMPIWFESGPVGQWDRLVFRDEDVL